MKCRLLQVLLLALTILGIGLVLGTVTPAKSSEFGPTLRALRLNGTDSYLEVQDAPALNPEDAITIEAWGYRLDSNRCETVIGKNYLTSYWLGFCTDKIRFYTHGSSTSIDGNASVIAGVWTHIAVTYDGTTRRYFINGELDLESTAGSAPLSGNTAPLGIGFDPSTSFPHNYFSGMLDEVRLWSIARTQADIQADMYQEVGQKGGLVTVWRMNGTEQALLPPYHTTRQGNVLFDTNGPLPFNLTAPLTPGVVTVDGNCGAGEYGSAERIGPRYHSLSTTYIQHTADDLYVCIEGLWRDLDSSVAVAIDRDYSREDLAQSGDYRFITTIDGTANAEEGDGTGEYHSLSVPPGSWNVVVNGDEFYWRAEFRLSRNLLALPTDWSTTIGMGIVAYGDPDGPNHWPVGAVDNSPLTWAAISFSQNIGPLPTHTLSGRVEDNLGNGLDGGQVSFWLEGSSELAIAHFLNHEPGLLCGSTNTGRAFFAAYVASV